VSLGRAYSFTTDVTYPDARIGTAASAKPNSLVTRSISLRRAGMHVSRHVRLTREQLSWKRQISGDPATS